MLYPDELRARVRLLCCCRFGLGERRREHGHGLYDLEAGAAQELVDDRPGEAGGVVLDADGLLGFVELDATNTVDFADLGDGKGGGLGGRRSVAVQDVKLGHAIDDSSGAGYVELNLWGFFWLRARLRV